MRNPIKPRVLVVEDDPHTRALISVWLGDEGCEVIGVPDGAAAIEVLGELTPDVAVLDLMMPGVDGLTLLRFMRERPATQATPVVILTARSDDDTAWESWTAGCDYFVGKPFEPEALAAAVLRLVRGAVPERSARPA